MGSPTGLGGVNSKGMQKILRRNLPFRREEVGRQEARRRIEAIGEPCKLEIPAALREHHEKSGGQLLSVGCGLTMRKSVLERDYPGQQAFPGKGGAILRGAPEMVRPEVHNVLYRIRLSGVVEAFKEILLHQVLQPWTNFLRRHIQIPCTKFGLPGH